MKQHENTSAPSSATRSIFSLLLVLHLTCVSCVLSSNINPSQLQDRLAGVFSPYTQLLHFHPGFARFHFTGSGSFNDDHFLVIETKEANPRVQLPTAESPWGLERHRLSALAMEVAFFADREEMAGYYARAVGGKVLREKQLKRMLFSCLHKASQPMDLTLLEPGLPADNPDAREYFETVYQAEVWIDEEGELTMQKRSVGRNAAPSSLKTTSP